MTRLLPTTCQVRVLDNGLPDTASDGSFNGLPCDGKPPFVPNAVLLDVRDYNKMVILLRTSLLMADFSKEPILKRNVENGLKDLKTISRKARNIAPGVAVEV